MSEIRNSVKAILIENGKLLFTKCRMGKGQEECFYILPGGGQEKGETLEEAVIREVLEEVGCDIAVQDVALVREHIDPHSPWGDLHQVEIFFHCRRISEIDPSRASNPDAEQIGLVWIDLDRLGEYRIYPPLSQCFTADGNVKGKRYLGNC